MRAVCTATHPVDLANGRPLGPGEVAEVSDAPHDRALVDSGHLRLLPEPEVSSDAGADEPAPTSKTSTSTRRKTNTRTRSEPPAAAPTTQED